MLSKHTSGSISVNLHDFIWPKDSWSSISYTIYKKIISVNFSQRQKKKDDSRHFYELSPVYIRLNIHATTRDKKINENFENAISITYDRVLQLKHLLTRRNLSKKFKKDTIACASERDCYSWGHRQFRS